MVFSVKTKIECLTSPIPEDQLVDLRIAQGRLKAYDLQGLYYGDLGRVIAFGLSNYYGNDMARLTIHLEAQQTIVVEGKLDACVWLMKQKGIANA